MDVTPDGPLEIVFSFDTTGSMYSCLEEVRGRLQTLIQRLQTDIPGIRLAVFAHGDYSDKHKYGYVTKHVNFSTDVAALCDFVKNVDRTGGGDSDECYELVLRQVRQELNWSPQSNKALVVIGDSSPHEPSYRLNTQKIDWREEAKLLCNMGVKIYGVQCGVSCDKTNKFYEAISHLTGGRHIQLEHISNIFDIMVAVCYKEHDGDFLQAYEEEIRERHPSPSESKDMEGVFDALNNPDSPPTPILDGSDEPEPPFRNHGVFPFKPRLTKYGSKVVPIPPLRKIKSLKIVARKCVKSRIKSRTVKRLGKTAPRLKCHFHRSTFP